VHIDRAASLPAPWTGRKRCGWHLLNCPCPNGPWQSIIQVMENGSFVLWNMEVPLIMLQATQQKRLLDSQQAKYVQGVLGMLIAVVGSRSCLGIILQQARSEVMSLLRSDELLESDDAVAA